MTWAQSTIPAPGMPAAALTREIDKLLEVVPDAVFIHIMCEGHPTATGRRGCVTQALSVDIYRDAKIRPEILEYTYKSMRDTLGAVKQVRIMVETLELYERYSAGEPAEPE